MRKDPNTLSRAGDKIAPHPGNELENARHELVRDLALLIRRKLRQDAMIAASGDPVLATEIAPATEMKSR